VIRSKPGWFGEQLQRAYQAFARSTTSNTKATINRNPTTSNSARR
jgi:hypothetical protein